MLVSQKLFSERTPQTAGQDRRYGAGAVISAVRSLHHLLETEVSVRPKNSFHTDRWCGSLIL